MSRLLVVIIAIVVVLVGAMFWLSGRDATKQPVKVEKAVSLENLS